MLGRPSGCCMNLAGFERLVPPFVSKRPDADHRKPFSLRCCSYSQVIKAWDEAMLDMKVRRVHSHRTHVFVEPQVLAPLRVCSRVAVGVVLLYRCMIKQGKVMAMRKRAKTSKSRREYGVHEYSCDHGVWPAFSILHNLSSVEKLD